MLYSLLHFLWWLLRCIRVVCFDGSMRPRSLLSLTLSCDSIGGRRDEGFLFCFVLGLFFLVFALLPFWSVNDDSERSEERWIFYFLSLSLSTSHKRGVFGFLRIYFLRFLFFLSKSTVFSCFFFSAHSCWSFRACCLFTAAPSHNALSFMSRNLGASIILLSRS